MYIGLGIVLLVLGLILVLDVITVDLDFINDDALGMILIVAGVLGHRPVTPLRAALAPRGR